MDQGWSLFDKDGDLKTFNVSKLGNGKSCREQNLHGSNLPHSTLLASVMGACLTFVGQEQ